jgi:hypothetical protein
MRAGAQSAHVFTNVVRDYTVTKLLFPIFLLLHALGTEAQQVGIVRAFPAFLGLGA